MIKTICTHNGNFHTDDVFALALLTLLFPNAEVIRSRSQEDFDRADLVVDVGLIYDPASNRFDHHQDGRAGTRENGIYYSGFGLVWMHYGLQYCEGDEEVFKRFDESLVASIDANDNGQRVYVKNDFDVEPYTIEDVVESYNPGTYEEKNFDTRFMDAVQIAKLILERKKIRYQDAIRAEKEFVKLYLESPNEKYVVLPRHLPSGRPSETLPELLFVVFPADANPQWMIRAVPKEKGTFVNRLNLPEAWRGKNGEELEKICGVKGTIFCHNAGFIASAKTKEAAIEMVELALVQQNYTIVE
jgi:uncharacterized UPF0160 family protein